MLPLRYPLNLLTLSLCLASSHSWASSSPASILVSSVKGSVSYSSNGSSSTLKSGDSIQPLSSVSTASNSSCSLSFPNGSSIQLKSNSSININEFSVASSSTSSSSQSLASSSSPSSKTDLTLAYGKLNFKVSPLHSPNSSYNIHTPAGVAGIRGTSGSVTYKKIKVKPSAANLNPPENKFFMQVDVRSGHVLVNDNIFLSPGESAILLAIQTSLNSFDITQIWNGKPSSYNPNYNAIKQQTSPAPPTSNDLNLTLNNPTVAVDNTIVNAPINGCPPGQAYDTDFYFCCDLPLGVSCVNPTPYNP